MAELTAPVPKKIVICCDGTWQSAVSGERNSPSNVTRLARCLNRVAEQDGKIWQQIVWYDSGVGTTSSWLGKKHEGAVGAGIEGNIIEAYNFVVLNWAPGDRILCFGFSRGAYTARSIAGLISDIGICQPWQLQDFHEIWKAYKSNYQGERFHGSDAYFDFCDGVAAAGEDQLDDYGYKNYNFRWKTPPHREWGTSPESRIVEVVGVYDTVGALGLPDLLGFRMSWGPDKHGFHNVELNPNIRHAFQALALDEHREAFSPTLWHLPETKNNTDVQTKQSYENQFSESKKRVQKASDAWWSKALDRDATDAERQELKIEYNQARRELIRLEEDGQGPSELLQVWFPGVHINIGGGSSDTLEEKGDLEAMSNITFCWMLDQISEYVSVDKHTIIVSERAEQARKEAIAGDLRKHDLKVTEDQKKAAEGSWSQWANHALTSAASNLTHSLTAQKKTEPNVHNMGWGTGLIIDSYTPMYRLNGSKYRTPGGYIQGSKHKTLGDTKEEIHPTVGYRYKTFRKLAAQEPANPKLRYHPAGQDPKRTQHGSGGWVYKFATSDKPLPEYKIGSKGFERTAMYEERRKDSKGNPLWRDTAAKYIRRLDIQNRVDVDDGWPLSDEGSCDEDWDTPTVTPK